MTERKKSIRWEWAVFFLFTISYVVITLFHEPWFDEAEAWQIAKCASLKEILFINPHYEGHPPLWHLLLLIPARIGLPFEMSIKLITGVFSIASIYLIEFKSPFSNMVKCLLPFGYFLFYQYGIIARPYCMMMLAVVLLSLSYSKKDEKPILMILSLMFLCLCSAYGIVLAGGIALVWVIQTIKNSKWDTISAFLSDKRVIGLFILLIYAIYLIMSIYPHNNARAIVEKGNDTFSVRTLFSSLFMIIPECFLTMFNGGYIEASDVSFFAIVCSAILELTIYSFLVLYSKKDKLLYFIIPFLFYVVFSSIVYIKPHHMGILLLLLIFYIWINCQDTSKNVIIDEIKISSHTKDILKSLKGLVLFICLTIPVVWNIVACVNDICVPYNCGRETASFLDKTGLSNALIYSDYSDFSIDDDMPDFNTPNYAVQIDAYFEHSVIANSEKGYITHIVLSEKEENQIKKELKQKGIPDVLLGMYPLHEVYGDRVELSDYVPVYKMCSTVPAIWKTSCYTEKDGNYDFVFLRKDLLDKYKLEPIPMN